VATRNVGILVSILIGLALIVLTIYAHLTTLSFVMLTKSAHIMVDVVTLTIFYVAI